MKRSIYYDGVELFAEHLNYTEETKIDAIRKIVTTMGVCGPVKGLVVMPDDTDFVKVMVTAGEGYTYGGDWYGFSSDVRGIVINNSNGVENYIVVELEEIEEYPVEDVISGEVRNTRISERYVIKVMSREEWQGIGDKSRYSLLGIVRGSGGLVRGSDIIRAGGGVEPVMFVESQPAMLKGVLFKTVSNNVIEGYGVLRYIVSGGEKILQWKTTRAGSNFGRGVILGGDGVYRLWDDLEIGFVDVEVVVGLLPSDGMDEVVKIVNLYGLRELSRGGMRDEWHRGMMGSGMPSPSNPHGQTLDDLDPGVNQDLIRHRRVEHMGAIVGNRGSLSLKAVVNMDNRTELIVNRLEAGDVIASGGKLIRSFGTLKVKVPNRDDFLSGDEVFVYINESGGISFEKNVDERQYCVVCKILIRWDSVLGSFVIDDVVDLRRWGSIRDVDVYYSGGGAINPAEGVEYSVNDSVRMIKWVLGGLSGTGQWDVLPNDSVKGLSEKVMRNRFLLRNIVMEAKGSAISIGNLGGDDEWFYKIFVNLVSSFSGEAKFLLIVNGIGIEEDGSYNYRESFIEVGEFTNGVVGGVVDEPLLVSLDEGGEAFVEIGCGVCNGKFRYSAVVNYSDIVEGGTNRGIENVKHRSLSGFCKKNINKVVSVNIVAVNSSGEYVEAVGAGSKMLVYGYIVS